MATAIRTSELAVPNQNSLWPDTLTLELPASWSGSNVRIVLCDQDSHADDNSVAQVVVPLTLTEKPIETSAVCASMRKDLYGDAYPDFTVSFAYTAAPEKTAIEHGLLWLMAVSDAAASARDAAVLAMQREQREEAARLIEKSIRDLVSAKPATSSPASASASASEAGDEPGEEKAKRKSRVGGMLGSMGSMFGIVSNRMSSSRSKESRALSKKQDSAAEELQVGVADYLKKKRASEKALMVKQDSAAEELQVGVAAYLKHKRSGKALAAAAPAAALDA